jgi:glycerol transport system ATP-binding protein
MEVPLALPPNRSETLTVGIRAGALRVHAQEGDLVLPGRVELAEIAGSDTFVHVRTSIGELVTQLTGVHVFSLGAAVTLYLNPAALYVFDAAGDLLVAPAAIPTAQR